MRNERVTFRDYETNTCSLTKCATTAANWLGRKISPLILPSVIVVSSAALIYLMGPGSSLISGGGLAYDLGCAYDSNGKKLSCCRIDEVCDTIYGIFPSCTLLTICTPDIYRCSSSGSITFCAPYMGNLQREKSPFYFG